MAKEALRVGFSGAGDGAQSPLGWLQTSRLMDWRGRVDKQVAPAGLLAAALRDRASHDRPGARQPAPALLSAGQMPPGQTLEH